MQVTKAQWRKFLKQYPQVKHLQPGDLEGKFLVDSESTPDVTYLVDLKAGSCQCPFFLKKQTECKHIKRMRQSELAKNGIKKMLGLS